MHDDIFNDAVLHIVKLRWTKKMHTVTLTKFNQMLAIRIWFFSSYKHSVDT